MLLLRNTGILTTICITWSFIFILNTQISTVSADVCDHIIYAVLKQQSNTSNVHKHLKHLHKSLYTLKTLMFISQFNST